MRDGFIKAAASTPEIRVADVDHNKKLICEGVDQAWKEGIQLLVYPELCLTGYTCGDLFWQEELLEKARQGLSEIVMHSLGKKMLIFVGLPWEMNGKLYNVAGSFPMENCWGWCRSVIFRLIRNFTRKETSHREKKRSPV